jgi:hypothetical protein
MSLAQLREDFPIPTFKHLEGKLQMMRSLLMGTAADLARKGADQNATSFIVTSDHIDIALASFIKEAGDNHRGVLNHFGLLPKYEW